MSPTAARKFPLLSTKHLTLRAPTLADAAAFRAVLSIPDVTGFSNWPDAPTKAQGERFLSWMSKLRYEGTLRQKAWFKGGYHDFRMFGRVAGDPTN